MESAALENSTSRKIIKKVLKNYYSFECTIGELYKYSMLAFGIKIIGSWIKNCAEHSFFWKLRHEERWFFIDIGGSMVLKLIACFIESTKIKIITYSESSRLTVFIKQVKTALQAEPLKTAGIIVFVAVFTNLAISILLKAQTGLSFWLIRVMFILLSMACLSGKIDLRKTKEASYVIKLFSGR